MTSSINTTADSDEGKAKTSSSSLRDFLTFKTMISPVIIQILFWIGVLGSVGAGIAMMRYQPSMGLLIIIGGPLGVRMWCELMILFFRINSTLTEIRNNQ